MAAISALVTGRRSAWVTLVACIVAIALAIVLLPRAAATNETGLPASAESQRVSDLLTTFPNPGTEYGIVVWSRADGGRLSDADTSAVDSRISALAPLSAQPAKVRATLARDRTATLVDIELSASGARASTADRIRTISASGLPTDLRAQLTGTIATPALGSTAPRGVDPTLLILSCVIALLVLVATRRPVLWFANLVVLAATGWLAIRIADAMHGAFDAHLSADARDLLFGMVVGLGALFSLLARYRRRTDIAIVVTSGLLALGALALLFGGGSAVRAFGATAAISVLALAVLRLTMLPALCSVVAPVLLWPTPAKSRDTPLRRPLLFSVVAAGCVSLISGGLLYAQVAAGPAIVTQSASQSSAQKTIDAAYDTGYGNRAVMLVPDSLAGETSTIAPTTLAMLYDTVNAVTRLGSTGGRTELVIQLYADPGSASALTTIRGIRAKLASTGGPTAQTLVGGADATTVDQLAAASSDRVVILWVGCVALVLLVVALLVLLLRRRGGRSSQSD
ncbi:MAG: MMPL family transporter [Actinomycetota bacterium]